MAFLKCVAVLSAWVDTLSGTFFIIVLNVSLAEELLSQGKKDTGSSVVVG